MAGWFANSYFFQHTLGALALTICPVFETVDLLERRGRFGPL